ncbi:MAG: dihydropteroate synthase [Candidatus Eisenbacteria bacterium]|uniref:Dihydropteroate synthase n=1 Tax=Eiseniibacteriota bacterium TaxID=2212470 RepID=A0A933SDH5_UNCEI|nr:dihydropteroate synthase [Candidatus Eisenbacteria bacterium]
MSASSLWRCRGRVLDLSARTAVMGIVNVTPDSFSDGGRFLDPAAAVARCRELAAEGADLLDLGAESTRPGAAAVPPEEQLRRLEPVLAALAARPAELPGGAGTALVSVDTRSAVVAKRALELGAHVINDVSALDDPDMGAAVAAAGAGLVLMHMRGTPETMQRETAYGDVVAEVAAHLRERRARAVAAGVADECLALDPGIGFAKSGEQSLELLARTAELAALGRPLLVGASRKSFLSRLLDGAPADQRLEGSLAAAALAVFEGAAIVRVHDVAATVRAVRVADAARAARAARTSRGTPNG